MGFHWKKLWIIGPILFCTFSLLFMLRFAAFEGLGIIGTLMDSPTGDVHEYHIEKMMTWECLPELTALQQKTGDVVPGGQAVRFRFVEDPHYEVVQFGLGLCDRLKGASKPAVSVDFRAWGSSKHGLIGFNPESVDGQPIINAGGMGSAGSTDAIGPHPLSKPFK